MSPEEARAAMVERLRADGVVRTPAVGRALATVPRHDFIEVDGIDVERAYADVAVIVKTDEQGTAVSSASQPTMVATMLELCRLSPGHRVLEIGTGTGYNAALLATIVGADGLVVTVELDADLASTARERLERHGLTRVEVVVGDGAAGHPGPGPYDRIVVTTGAPRIAPAWVDQLRPGGRLVVPVVDRDGMGWVHCLVERDGRLEERTRVPCGFLPMRSP